MVWVKRPLVPRPFNKLSAPFRSPEGEETQHRAPLAATGPFVYIQLRPLNPEERRQGLLGADLGGVAQVNAAPVLFHLVIATDASPLRISVSP